ncbi:MAG: acyltransferase, partial [Firmicutes bacterium]|nr:acyltransferase [Bacillota bacterium]
YSPVLTSGPAMTSAFLLVLIRYAVPMFIFITGLVLFYNHGPGEFNYPEFIRKRFSQIFIPYAAWTAIYYFWSGMGSGHSFSLVLADLVRVTVSGDAAYHLWFMVAIMQFYLLFPFFRWFILKFKDRAVSVLSLGLLVYIALMWFNTYQAPQIYEQTQLPLLKNLLAYRDRLFISWFFYFLLGGYAGLYARKLRIILTAIQKINVWVYLLSFGLVLLAVVKTGRIGPSGTYMMNYMFTLPLTPAMVIFLTSSLLTIYYLSLTLFMKNQLITRILRTFGRYSYGCYFVHALVLYYTNAFIQAYLPGLAIMAQLGLAFTACALISLALCFLISLIRLPLGNILVGKYPPKTT